MSKRQNSPKGWGSKKELREEIRLLEEVVHLFSFEMLQKFKEKAKKGRRVWNKRYSKEEINNPILDFIVLWYLRTDKGRKGPKDRQQ